MCANVFVCVCVRTAMSDIGLFSVYRYWMGLLPATLTNCHNTHSHFFFNQIWHQTERNCPFSKVVENSKLTMF